MLIRSGQGVPEIAELGALTGPVLRELRKGEIFKQRLAQRRQEEAARVGGVRRRRRRGGASPFMQVPPESFHYWGQRLGYECWDDPQFVREFLRDNPECRVQTRADEPQVGWKPIERRVRYHKSFGELGKAKAL